MSQSSRGPGGLCIDHSVSLTEAVNPAPHSLTNLFSSSSSKESPDPVRFGFFHCMNFRLRRFVKCQTFQATLSDSWLLYSVFDANVFLLMEKELENFSFPHQRQCEWVIVPRGVYLYWVCIQLTRQNCSEVNLIIQGQNKLKPSKSGSFTSITSHSTTAFHSSKLVGYQLLQQVLHSD